MSGQGNHLYEFGPFLLDARSRILLKNGVTVRLTPKAFDTLLVLVEHASQVVEKEQLLKEVWPDSFVEEGSLSHNIHGLRKVLGDYSSEPRYIETIPKRGYRFVAPVKVSTADSGPIGLPGVGGDAVVIEKHAFARVISDEFEGTDLSAAFEGAGPPADDAPLRSAAGTQALAPAGVSEQRKKRSIRAAVVAALFVVSTIAVSVYMKRAPAPAPPVSRAKSTLVRLSNNNAMDAGPVWSPDGSSIAFWGNRDGKREIYVMDADGSNVRRLTNNLADDDNPRWSPDARRIVFDSERDGNKEIYVMDADGGNQTRLTRNNTVDSAATWSPDGNLIAFASNRDTGLPYNLDIYVMNADGSNVRRIVDDPEYDVGPNWSPDGRKILFLTGRNGNFDVYEMNVDGARQRNLTADSDKSDISPAWSRDGHSIAFL